MIERYTIVTITKLVSEPCEGHPYGITTVEASMPSISPDQEGTWVAYSDHWYYMGKAGEIIHQLTTELDQVKQELRLYKLVKGELPDIIKDMLKE